MNKKQMAVQFCAFLSLAVILILNYIWIGSVRSFTDMETIQLILASLSIVLFDCVFTFLARDKKIASGFVVISTSIITILYILYQIIMSFVTPILFENQKWFLTYHIMAGFILFFSYALIFIFENQRHTKVHEKK